MTGLILAVSVAVGLVITWAVYADRIAAMLAGSGKRRFTVESADQADKTIRGLKAQLAGAKARPCGNCGHLPDWPTNIELATSDRSDPDGAIRLAAPVDVHGTQALKPDTVPLAKPRLLTGLVAQDPEATQSLGVQALRDAASMDAGTTVTMPKVGAPAVSPVVAVLPEERRRTTWGVKPADPVEAALSLPGPPPGAGASEISMATGLKAVTQVHAIVTEAAS